ncbi:hypothetical protein LTR36_010384 [Oleoguttula mirabilis]|uniref:INO80 complex, subunit Ies4 n=1 Tax=Oleoguttula mirabilis TaxID=1507867 RepID=A0AAV9J5W4_9PEZI|nr:hypothetical protein LTR36_010384 [Oleoguttula mirabilis]
MSAITTTTKSTPKTTKKTRVITLRLSPKQLADFPTDVTPKPSASPPKIEPSPSLPPPETTEKTSESNATPVPPVAGGSTDNNSLAPPKVDKRRRGGAAATGRKRAPPSIDPNGPMRERGRPGPKKKPRLADGTIDHSTENTKKGPVAGANPTSTHRLGPKANTGNINANLRALDRTGKPCRKWDRKPLQIKSFTGTMWPTSTWKAPERDAGFAGDVKSDTTGSSDLKPNNSSAVASERSNSGNDHGESTLMRGIESSPALPMVPS